jgi:thioredoxin reductase
MLQPHPRLAILGSGPTGLESALAAADQGWPFTVYEAADRTAAHVRAWGHVRLFTPWSMNVSGRMARHLAAADLPVPEGDDCPIGDELCDRLLDPLAALPEVAPAIRYDARVTSVGRRGLLKHEEIATASRGGQPFRLLVSSSDGHEELHEADVVLDCTGTYSHPNSTGDGGIPAAGERGLGDRIRRTVPDVTAEAGEWAGQTVLVVGAGHSAQTAAAELAAFARSHPGTEVVWAVRSTDPTWGEVADDTLPQRAALVARSQQLAEGGEAAVRVERGVVVEALAEREGRVAVTLRNGSTSEVVVDRVLSLTGSVGDASLYRQLQVHECYATGAPINLSAALLGAAGGDCLQQESHGVDALRNPEPNFFILGAKSYGRVNQFLLRVGWEQVDEVFGALDATSEG